VQRPQGRGVSELADGRHDPPPGRRSIIIAGECELVSSDGALLNRMFSVALQQLRARQMSISGITLPKLRGRRSIKD
jgi:hypothetical protein